MFSGILVGRVESTYSIVIVSSGVFAFYNFILKICTYNIHIERKQHHECLYTHELAATRMQTVNVTDTKDDYSLLLTLLLLLLLLPPCRCKYYPYMIILVGIGSVLICFVFFFVFVHTRIHTFRRNFCSVFVIFNAFFYICSKLTINFTFIESQCINTIVYISCMCTLSISETPLLPPPSPLMLATVSSMWKGEETH